MMKRFLLIFVAALSAAFSVSALESTAGKLASLVSDPTSTTSLTITGTLNAADLKFIAENMPALRDLDLSGATIVKSRGNNAIYGDGEIPASTFAGCKLQSIKFPAAQPVTIGTAAFTGSGLTAIAIPANVGSVELGAFSACSALTSASLNADTHFGTDIFSSCDALKSVNLCGAAVVTEGMFASCPALEQVTGAERLSVIGTRAFAGDAALTFFDFPATLTSVGDEAFTHSGLTSAQMGDCRLLTSLGERSFASCSHLQAVSLPATITTLGEGVMAMCPELTTLVMPEPVAVIPDYAFTSTPGVSAQTALVNGVETVGAYAFKGHTEATSLVIPSTIAYLGDNAMEGMTGLAELDADQLESVPELGSDVWKGVDQSKVDLKVSSAMADAFRAAEQWQDFAIKASTSAIDNIAGEEQSVRARFDGDVLVVESTGSEIAELEVYDINGVLLASQRPDAFTATVATGSWSANVLIVRARLANGSLATAKVLRLL